MTRESGQAAVELIGIVPLLLMLVAAVWQLALAGQSAWLAAHAARAAARAGLVGQDRDAAARSTLPAALERGLDVEGDGGSARVRLRLPLLGRGPDGPVVGARASLEAAE